jgi:AcrR family transcriptional regulator
VQALLEATALVLVRDGYDRASTNRIAEAAGVNIASLYQYFPSKEALVAAVFEAYLRRVRGALTTAIESAEQMPVVVGVENLVRRFFELHDEAPALHRALLTHVPHVERLNPMLALRAEVLQGVTSLFVRRRRELRVKHPELAAVVVVTCVEALKQSSVLEDSRRLFDERFVGEVMDLLRRYLSTE